MANIPYYADPVFLEKMKGLQQPSAPFASPFAATQRMVANRLAERATQRTGLNLQRRKADAGYRQSLFNNELEYKRRLREAELAAERKRRRKGLFSSGLGIAAGVAGSIFGGPAGGAAGAQIGQSAGGLFR